MLTGETLRSREEMRIYPARHFVTPEGQMKDALEAIRAEFTAQFEAFQKQGKILEAERLKHRVEADLEMLQTTGSCSGVENYSRHLSGRSENDRPETLLDYFPDDWVLFVDESHVSVPQLKAMWRGE